MPQADEEHLRFIVTDAQESFFVDLEGNYDRQMSH